MKKSAILILGLALLGACGDKHTFDTPVSGSGTGNFQSDNTQNLSAIVEITAHDNPADYYNDGFHAKYLSKLSNPATISQADLDKLKSELNKVLKWEHTRVPGKRDTTERCPKGAPESESCYSHDFDTYRDYQRARTYLYGKIDLFKNDAGEFALDTIYCQKVFTTNDLQNPQYSIGVMRRPDYNTINAEHIWPRSKFEEIEDSKYYNLKLSDLHNLAPSFITTNSKRSNLPFGSLSNGGTVTNDFSQYCADSEAKLFTNNGKTYMDAPDAVKGDIARAMFYMSARYFNSKNKDAMNIDPEQEATLREWHKLDPVSDKERERNNKVFSVQHNRNPFIDYPELVELVKDF
ncbi:hypothetical protein BIY24_06355 [Halobacteriovorax marinus]|uniref:Membrane-bound endonuclease n=1 Tax=Halobacteriovorax marinus (strain ATCC BAA-682 / DSM 15412 / SJ) TaxID=862908 RepID=E1WZM4_HALMS|nr:endonuclease [Halobacteriovorax marinus]ATH07579.1 hypothetical protein BIY24_06355 [Halobacteriovorax marinus]CBW26210.1 putative membrane-bound endonuclease [Halobacteriovorax marinus SJ]